MMILVWLLTAVLVVDCAFLVLLVLVQLPKKEAGAGLAFGGGATDALFGAGSGTALTKITKYAAIVFFSVTLVLSVMSGQMNKGRVSAVEEKLKEKSGQSAPAAPFSGQPSAPATTPTPPASPAGAPSAPLVTPAPTSAPPAANAPATTPEASAPQPK